MTDDKVYRKVKRMKESTAVARAILRDQGWYDRHELVLATVYADKARVTLAEIRSQIHGMELRDVYFILSQYGSLAKNSRDLRNNPTWFMILSDYRDETLSFRERLLLLANQLLEAASLVYVDTFNLCAERIFAIPIGRKTSMRILETIGDYDARIDGVHKRKVKT